MKKNIIVLRDTRIYQHKISRRLKIPRRCIRQIFRKFDRFDTVSTKPGAECAPKVTDLE